jgi:hypothetical protein
MIEGLQKINIIYKNSPHADEDMNNLLNNISFGELKKSKRGHYDISGISNKFEANARILLMKSGDFFNDNKVTYPELKKYFLDSLYVVTLTTKDCKRKITRLG